MVDIEYIMEEYFLMKKAYKDILEKNRCLLHETNVYKSELEEAKEKLKVIQSSAKNDSDSVCYWVRYPTKVFSRCSGCGEQGYAHYDYCPWCGSKMIDKE